MRLPPAGTQDRIKNNNRAYTKYTSESQAAEHAPIQQ